MAVDLSPYMPIEGSTRKRDVFDTSQVLKILNTENELPFCNSGSSDECVDYLSKELQMLGFGSLYAPDGTFDKICLINCTYQLLKKYQRSSRHREELESRICRGSAELEYFQSFNKTLKSENESLKTNVARSEERERQIQSEYNTLKMQNRSLNDELKRLKSNLQFSDRQYRHDVKKKERQLIELKEKTQQLLIGKTCQQSSLEISNCLQRSDGKRAKWKNEASSTRNEEEMHNLVVNNMLSRCRELLSENNRLREILSDIYQELVCIPTKTESKSASPLSSSKDIFQLPIDMIKDRIMPEISKSCNMLRSNSNILDTTFTLSDGSEDENAEVSRSQNKQHKQKQKLSIQDGRSPRRSRISEHMELVKIAVEESKLQNQQSF